MNKTQISQTDQTPSAEANLTSDGNPSKDARQKAIAASSLTWAGDP